MAIRLKVGVVGGGVFGLAAAASLADRGFDVHLFDKGTIPDPLAASTDISKVVRMEYGPDELYMELGERAREGWLRWNDEWAREGLAGLYHETGALTCARSPMSPGGFEYESHKLLNDRGHKPVRMNGKEITSRFRAWNRKYFTDGFYNPEGGFVESSEAIRRMADRARGKQVKIFEQSKVTECLYHDNKIAGLRVDGQDLRFDVVLLAAGAWNPVLWPSLKNSIRPTGHPVFHFKPKHTADFQASVFPTFLADISTTGYYGFPINADGVVKIGKHSTGIPIHPDDERVVVQQEVGQVRAFLAAAIPSLREAELVYTRLCLYADSADSDFWIAEDPDCTGLFVSGCGSGHGFKFAPVIGDVIADIVQGLESKYSRRFRWRPEVDQVRGNEASRFFESEKLIPPIM